MSGEKDVYPVFVRIYFNFLSILLHIFCFVFLLEIFSGQTKNNISCFFSQAFPFFAENISKPDGKIIFPVFLQVPSSLFASLGKPWLIMESVWQTDDEDAHDDQQ